MTGQRDMRCLAERFIRRHGQDIDVLDADRLAGRLQRYVPLEMRGAQTLTALRSIVIHVASQSFVPTRWGRLAASQTSSTKGRAGRR